MRNKVVFLVIIFLLLLGIVFANSYVQALSRQERLMNCNNCEYNENCEVYYKNNNCIKRNNTCLQRNNNCRRNCSK